MVTVLQKKFLVQWRNLHDFPATVFSWMNQEITPCSLSVRYPATPTGKGKNLSSSVFYWVIQKKFLECIVYNVGVGGGFLLPWQWNKKIFAHKVQLYTNYHLLVYGSSGTISRCFYPQKICSRGGATNSKTRALLEHWSATNMGMVLKILTGTSPPFTP